MPQGNRGLRPLHQPESRPRVRLPRPANRRRRASAGGGGGQGDSGRIREQRPGRRRHPELLVGADCRSQRRAERRCGGRPHLHRAVGRGHADLPGDGLGRRGRQANRKPAFYRKTTLSRVRSAVHRLDRRASIAPVGSDLRLDAHPGPASATAASRPGQPFPAFFPALALSRSSAATFRPEPVCGCCGFSLAAWARSSIAPE